MKIITKAVYQMNDDGSLSLESEDSHYHNGPIAEAKSSPSAPPAPDPAVAISAQAEANRINVQSPFGSTRFTGPGGAPASDITRTDVLDPSQQRQFEQRNVLGEALLGRAQRQLPQIEEAPFAFQGDPETDLGFGEFAPGVQDVSRRIVGRQTELLQPQFDKQDRDLRQKLANQGIPEGSELFDQQLAELRKSQGTTLSQVAQQADVTGFGQALGERQQVVGEAVTGRQLGAAERGQRFGEETSQRQLNFNELAALLGGQQLTPSFAPTANIDVAGPFAQQQAGQLAQFQAQQQSANSFNQGLLGLGSAGIAAFSDRRLKKNIKRIGTHILGIGIYTFEYLWGESSTGVMADELRDVMPAAVTVHDSGYDMVNYAMIGGV